MSFYQKHVVVGRTGKRASIIGDPNIGNKKDTFKSEYFQSLLYLPYVSLKGSILFKRPTG